MEWLDKALEQERLKALALAKETQVLISKAEYLALPIRQKIKLALTKAVKVKVKGW